MKKVFMIFAACAAVFSCQKVSTENTLEPSEAYLSIALDEATKAHFGELDGNNFPTLWNQSFDNAAVVGSGLNGTTAVSVSADSKSVRFNFENVGMATLTANTNLYNAEEHEYTYCVYSPFDNNYSDAHKVNERGGAYAQPSFVRMWIPVIQNPGVGTPDENAVVLFGRITKSLETEADLSISGLVLNHLTAYGKLSFRNLDLAAGEKVETVVLTAAENICGAFGHQYKDGEDLYDVGSSLKSKVLTLNTEATTDIYFSVLPATLTALNIKVTTDKGTVFLKDLDLTEHPLAFVKGQVKPVNVDMKDTKQATTPALTEAWLDFGTRPGVVEGYNTIKTVPSTALSLNNKDGVESRGTVKVASGSFSFENPSNLSVAITVAGISWPLDVWTDYLYATAPGSLEFAGLESGRTYKFIVLCCRNSGSHLDGTNPVRATEVTIGGEAKTAISGIKNEPGYQNYLEDLAVVFDTVTPDANGKVTVGLKGVGTHATAGNQITVSAIHIIRNDE